MRPIRQVLTGFVVSGLLFGGLAFAAQADAKPIFRAEKFHCSIKTGWCTWSQTVDFPGTAPLVGRSRPKNEIKSYVYGYVGSDARIVTARTTSTQPTIIVATGKVYGDKTATWRLVGKNLATGNVRIVASGRYCVRVKGYPCMRSNR